MKKLTEEQLNSIKEAWDFQFLEFYILCNGTNHPIAKLFIYVLNIIKYFCIKIDILIKSCSKVN